MLTHCSMNWESHALMNLVLVAEENKNALKGFPFNNKNSISLLRILNYKPLIVDSRVAARSSLTLLIHFNCSLSFVLSL